MRDSLNAVFVFAPQGRGKTRHAQALAAMFECTSIVEDWDGVSDVPDGALVLSNSLPAAVDGLAAGAVHR